jgi:hypothetical protein
MIGKTLVYSGVITYLLFWAMYFFVTRTQNICETERKAMFIYCLVPWGPVLQSGAGGIITMLGG